MCTDGHSACGCVFSITAFHFKVSDEKLSFVVGYGMTSKRKMPLGVYVLWFATILNSVSYDH